MSRLYLLLAAALTCFTAKICTDELVQITPEQLKFTERGMFLEQDHSLYHVKKIEEKDSFYIATIDNASAWYWVCPECGQANSFYARRCTGCGYLPPH